MINGVIAVPIMVVMMLLGTQRGPRVLGWLATVVMALAVVAMVATL